MTKLHIMLASLLTLLVGVLIAEFALDWNKLLPSSSRRKDIGTPDLGRNPFPEQGEDLSDFLAAPVFDPQRRALPIGGMRKTAGGLDDVMLIGIVRSDEATFAILTKGTGGDAQRLKLGDAYSGFRLIEIGSESVVLQGPGGKTTMTIEPPEN